MSNDNIDLLGFFEISADLQQNRQDQYLTKDNIAVKYVFDADIIGLFVSPLEYLNSNQVGINPHRGFSFDWGIQFWKGSGPNFKTEERAQHALIMSEYLMSGELPGDSKKLYFTTWHNAEVSNQFRMMSSSLLSASRSEIEKGLLNKIELYAAALAQTDAMKALSHMKEITEILAVDIEYEPLEQLSRFLQEIKARGSIIDDEIEIDESSWGLLQADAKFWFEELKSVIKRDPDRLKRDALSIAFLRFAIKRQKANERILFVTGDNKLFNVYRNWYYKNDINEPFFLRRFAQFSPLLNMVSAKSDLNQADGSKRIFESIDNIVNAVVVRAVLASDQGNLMNAIAAIKNPDRRQWLPWYFGRMPGCDSFFSKLSSKDQKSIRKIKDGLSRAQESAVGLFSVMSAKRLSLPLRNAILEADKKDFAETINAYVENELMQVEKGAIDFMRDADLRYVSSLYGLRPGPHRTPDTLLYKIGEQTLADVVRRIDSRLENYEKISVHFRDFIDVRAFGAAVALSTHSWSDARHYSAGALEFAKTHKDKVAGRYSELLFLHCVTTRFWLVQRIWDRFNSSGEILLEQGLREFLSIADKLDEINGDIGFRAVSEKAALFLFKAQLLYCLSSSKDGAFLPLSVAVSGLLDCYNSFGISGKSGCVFDQVMHNFAACYVLAHVMSVSEAKKVFVSVPNSVWLDVDEFTKNKMNEKRSGLLVVELYAYIFLRYGSIDDMAQLRNQIKSAANEDNLGMDKFILNLMGKRLQETDSITIS